MWPECINSLQAFPVALRDEPPEELLKAFHRLGWPQTPGSLPVRMVALLGQCTTDRYVDCPNMPSWHIENAEEEGAGYLQDIGLYLWCDFDIVGRKGKPKHLRMVFNLGDPDCNDGIWGAVWDRKTGVLVADIASVGDCQSCVTLVSGKHAKAYTPHQLPIPTDRNQFKLCKTPTSLVYANDAEFEQLIGVAIGWCSSYRFRQ